MELLVIRSVSSGVLTQIRGKVKAGSVIVFANNLKAVVISCESNGDRVVEFLLDDQQIAFEELVAVLERIGHIPLPPYIKRSDETADQTNYQTCFAKELGSVAAPTASLHFDDVLLQKIKKRHKSAELTLHIGLGTFKSVESEDIRSHQMHSESYTVSDRAKNLIASNQPLLAVGTTACRTIEHFVRTDKPSGECDLFLHPANRPLRVDHLLTNFHLPKSTLIMLVASFVGLETTKELYNVALEHDYRFFSYGDAMLII